MFCKSKVADLVDAFVDKNVGRLKVPMNDLFLDQLFEATNNLLENLIAFLLGNESTYLEVSP